MNYSDGAWIGRLRFYRALALAAWALATIFLLVPLIWIAVMPSFDHEGISALVAFAIAAVVGTIGYVLTMTLIKRWSA